MHELFNLFAIERCLECRGCEQSCPVFQALADYNPNTLLQDILEGEVGPWLEREMIWQCLECHTCSEMCPQRYSWEDVFTTLKSLAIREGKAPEQVSRGVEILRRTGRLGEPRAPLRKKLGLPASPQLGWEELLSLLGGR